MEALQRPTRTTASTSTVLETARGTHVFKMTGYSLHVKGLRAGNFIRSATFAVGGYDWCIRYYPGGYGYGPQEYASVLVELRSKLSKVRALFDLRLTNHATGLSSSVYTRPSSSPAFKNSFMGGPTDHIKGSPHFMKRTRLEAWPYLHHDCLIIECDLTVVNKTQLLTAMTSEIKVPPSDLPDNLAKLLETKRGADVAFEVRGEVFHAHKLVLAMRSRVFDAELYDDPTAMCGDKEDDPKHRVTIEDMQPAVFRALLHFVYTDSLPAMDDLDEHDKKEMIKHLLVAADRYSMDRMKLMCESILSKDLDAIAHQHHCSKLKVACIEFIKSSRDDQHLKRGCASEFVHISGIKQPDFARFSMLKVG